MANNKAAPDVNWTGATAEVAPGLWAKQPRPCAVCGMPAQYGTLPTPKWFCTEHWIAYWTAYGEATHQG